LALILIKFTSGPRKKACMFIENVVCLTIVILLSGPVLQPS